MNAPRAVFLGSVHGGALPEWTFPRTVVDRRTHCVITPY